MPAKGRINRKVPVWGVTVWASGQKGAECSLLLLQWGTWDQIFIKVRRLGADGCDKNQRWGEDWYHSLRVLRVVQVGPELACLAGRYWSCDLIINLIIVLHMNCVIIKGFFVTFRFTYWKIWKKN